MRTRSFTIARRWVLWMCVAFAGGMAAPAAAAADGPVSLVITYRAKPENRVAFREWLEREGTAQFAQWKRNAVVADCLVLFSTFAATTSVDAVVVLDFARYTDSARWKDVEKRFPGGLSAAGLRLAAPEATFYAETLNRGGKAERERGRSVFLLAFYEVLVSAEKYRNYADGYIIPQMHGWLEADALASYRLLFNHAPLSVVWDAILVLEYTDIAALARRDDVKTAVRARLAQTDPDWVTWSRDKSDLRREKALLICEAIPLPES